MKNDLSFFSHFHPYFDPITGRFQIALNLPYSDPDNFDAITGPKEPGMYMLMADVDIRGKGMRMSHTMLMIMGQEHKLPLILDTIDSHKKIIKHFKNYYFKLSHQIFSGCMSNLNEFTMEVFENKNNHLVPVTDFQPWLEEGAHAVWASEGLMHGHHMYYAHMHAPLPEEGNQLIFSFFDQATLKAGVQKLWVQFKHQNIVHTIPFIFEYYPPTLTGELCR